MLRTTIIGAAGSLLLAGCTAGAVRPLAPASTPVVEAPSRTVTGWKLFASPADQARLADLPRRFAQARAALPASLNKAVQAEGPLLDPAAAAPLPQLPPGSYRCRLVRLGGAARFRTYPADFCYVDAADDRLAFTKQTGSTLPEGYVYSDTATSQVFLGTMRAAGEKAGRAYGADPSRDLVGLVTRVAPFRWRLVLAHAGRDADIDLYELVPVTPDVPDTRPRS
ncbi:DUF4893 domain-containing protein [Sphingomonas aerophila]|uniref:DUF4893 domain-containing protein n=1 Tax=Sphingomonas aerophila TaxID=1344948 RepID=A0A7W9BAL9_9SPHN|nr:DUF4893 domain-containing protein [Sphingomonas aerophila]MBB5713702.1 hypothetical protein [Sphingomonas aerophila]